MRIGYSREDITPDLEARRHELSGYGYMLDRCATGILDRLYFDSLVVEGDDGNVCALSSAHLVGIGSDTVKAIKAKVHEETRGGIPKNGVLISATHTHSGPASVEIIGAGGYDSYYVDNVLIPRAVSSIKRAYDGRKDGAIGTASIRLQGVSYNRIGRGELDDRLVVMKAEFDGGSAMFLNFPCHPVVLGRESTLVSKDFPGEACRYSEESLGLDGSVYTIGCCGDIDPAVNRTKKGRTTEEDVRNIGEAVGRGACMIYSDIRTNQGNVRAHERMVRLPLSTHMIDKAEMESAFRRHRSLPPEADITSFSRWIDMVSGRIKVFPEYSNVPLSSVRIGDSVLVGVGAEMFCGFALDETRNNTTILSMTGGYIGYIPPDREKGSYAGSWSSFLFGRGPFREGAEEQMSKQVSSLIEKTMN